MVILVLVQLTVVIVPASVFTLVDLVLVVACDLEAVSLLLIAPLPPTLKKILVYKHNYKRVQK